MTWTDARIAELARLWAAGISASGIAEALGDVSRSAVLGKLHRLRLLKSRNAASAPRRFEGVPSAAPPVQPPTPPAAAASSAAAPEPPRSPWREEVFAPLPRSSPKPWLAREFAECAFPVGGEGAELVSCCEPTAGRSAYCARHHRIVFRPFSPAARAAEQRRWDNCAETWSGAAPLELDQERTAA
jgi:GcrA cell cycle regulator